MSTVKVIRRKDKEKANGEAPLYLRITKNRRSRYVSIGVYVTDKDWDEVKCMVRKTYPNSVRTNRFIAQKVAEAMGVGVDMESVNKHVSAKALKEAITGRSSISFLDYADNHLKRLEAQGRIGYHDKTKAVVSKVRTYMKGRQLTIDEVTVHWLKQYELYLITELKNAPNTVHSNMKIIRTIIGKAVEDDLLPFEKNPFLKYKLKWTKTKPQFLTSEELERLEKLEFATDTKLELHRDMFVFAADAGGIRVGDLLNLRARNFDGSRLILYTAKTTDPLSIKLTDRACSIANKYREDGWKPDDFLFPCIPNGTDMDDPRTHFRVKQSKNAQINTNLKKLAKQAGIEKRLTFHVSRHTFGTRAVSKMPMEHVSKLMTHANIKQTQLYARIMGEDLDSSMDKLND